MQVSVQDTTAAGVHDTVEIVPRDYYIGSVIPVDSSGSSFPDTLVTSNHAYAKAFAAGTRQQGLTFPEKALNTDFSFGVLSLSLFFLALLAIQGRKTLINSLSALSIKKPFTPPVGGALGVFSWAPVLSVFYSMLNVALFITVGMVTTGMMGTLPGIETVRVTGLIFGSLVIALLLRQFSCIVVGAVSGQRAAFREYRTVIGVIWFLTGTTLFFMSIIILFTPLRQPATLVWAGLATAGILFFYRIIRLLIIFIKQHVSILYFILYLCALEVLPVMIVLKLLSTF